MNIPLAFLLFNFISFHVLNAEENGTYLITAYSYLRPYSNYRITISWIGSSKPLTVSAKLSSINGKFNEKLEAIVPVAGTSFINFKVQELPNSGYRMNISGFGGSIAFAHSKEVQFLAKNLSIFIQLAKAIFQPGQNVHYRVIVVNANLKPVSPSNGVLTITDARKDIIKLENGIKIVNGIYKGLLELSNQPNLGDWNLEVRISGTSVSKIFTVAEYVLPKFEVAILPLTPIKIYESVFSFIVQAKYTFQKPLSGKVRATARINNYYCSYYPLANNCRTTEQNAVLDEDGKAILTFNPIELKILDFYSYYNMRLNVTATVEDDRTGKEQTYSKTFPFETNTNSIDISFYPKFYKPGLPLNVRIQLKDKSGGPLINPVPNTVNVSFSNGQSLIANLSSEGSANFLYTAPSSANDHLSIQVTHKVVNGSAYVTQAHAQLNNYIIIKAVVDQIQVGETRKFEILSTFDMKQINYQIIGRGLILESKYKNVTSDPRKVEIKVIITKDMAPSAFLIVYVMNPNGEIVGDSLKFTPNGFFRTPVKLVVQPNDVTPNSSVHISVTTNPNAYVCLSAVDQSSLILKSGNEVTPNDVISDIENYNHFYELSNMGFLIGKNTLILNALQQALLVPGIFYFTNSPFDNEEIGKVTYGEEDQLFQIPNSKLVAPLRLRSNFPEAWIWTDMKSGPDGVANMTVQSPDTITSWILSACAMDEETGLGLSPTQTKLRVFRPFFISLNIPYSIVHGEILSLQAIVFNYGDNDVKADVMLKNTNNDLKFMDGKINQFSRTISVQVKAGKSVSVQFNVSGTKVGIGIFTISAISKDGTLWDIVQQTLMVKAEGKPVYFNRPVLIDLTNGTTNFEYSVPVEIPPNAIIGSENVQVFGIGDILGPNINNLDKLLEMPHGCGEQNMVTMMPNIAVLNYLQSVDRSTPEIKDKATRFMEKGYQSELTYKRSDNSFSAFGEKDSSGSTMLTAFVVKSFFQAKRYINVSDDVLTLGLSFLARNQNSDGCFKETGRVLDAATFKTDQITAYILIAFLTIKNERYTQTISSAKTFLEKQLPTVYSNPYGLAITTYALKLANSSKSSEAFAKLKASLTTEGDKSYVKVTEPRSDVSQYCYYGTPTRNVEATAYAIMTFLLFQDISGGLPLMRWLTSQRNERGGFTSTQDTAIGLEALAKIAAVLAKISTSMEVLFSYQNASAPISMNINGNNAIVLQSKKVPSSVRHIKIDAKGKGWALVQVAWSYNVLKESPSKSNFDLRVKVSKSQYNGYHLMICSRISGKKAPSSGMAIVEVTLPSGYEFDSDEKPGIDIIARVDLSNGNTLMNVYFTTISSEDSCFNAIGVMKASVANLKETTVTVYEYYEPVNRMTVAYTP